MFIKDLFRLIKTSFNRFIFLLCIVLIGVGFLMGLRATPSIMMDSINDYYNDYNFRDLKLYSNFGFCDKDIEAFSNEEYIDDVYPSYEKDAYIKTKEDEIYVARFREIDSNLNNYKLVSGRLPSSNNECIISNSHLFSISTSASDIIGTYIDVYLENDEIGDYLKNNRYKIVGTFDSPEFLSKILSTSNLDNKELDTVLLINNDNFISDYYSCLNISFKNSKDYNTFHKEYDNYVDECLVKVDEFSATQKYVCKNVIVEKALEEIKKGEDELKEEKEKGEKELKDAKKKLDKALKEIKDGEKQIKDGEQEILDNEQKIIDNENLLNDKKGELNNAISAIESSFNTSYSNAYNTVKTSYNDYKALNDSKTTHNLDQRFFDNAPLGTQDSYNAALNNLPDETTAQTILTTIYSSYDSFVDQILEMYDSNFNGSLASVYNNFKQIEDGKKAIDNGFDELNDAKWQISEAKKTLEESKAELKKGKKEYKDGLKEYEDALDEFNEKIDDAQKEIDDAYKEIEDLADPKWIRLDRSLDYSYALYKGSCEQMDKIADIMPLLFFLVGILVCITTMTRLIQEQRGQIGIYRALGYSKNVVVFKYIAYVLIASLLGSVLGIIIGMAIFPPVIYNTWKLIYISPSMKLVIPKEDILLSLFSFTSIMVIVTYFVARDTLFEKPSDLLRPKAPKSSKPIILEKIKFIWNKVSFTSKVTFRNLFRYKARFFMTIIGVAGCTGLLVLGFGIKDSISDVVEVQYDEFYQYNYCINLDNKKDNKDIYKLIDRLDEDENISNVSPFFEYSGKVYINNVEKILNVEIFSDSNFDDSYNLLNYKTDKIISLKDDGIIITEKFAKNNKLKEGDIITLESYDGSLKDVVINDICKTYFQHYIYISDTLYNNLFNEDIDYNKLAIKSDLDISSLDKYIDNDVALSATDFSSFISSFEHFIESLDLIVLVIIITAGSLAFVVLFNLIAVNIAERLREIATLKVLGFRRKEVHYYIFKELLLLSFIGGLIGLIIGRYEVNLVMNIINIENIMFSCNVKMMSYCYSFAITIIFTLIVLIFTRKSLDDIKMIESLKSVE